MKQRITVDDLKKLTNAQKKNLRDLWIPARHSLAVASVCTNAETDEYAEIEFCIGGVKVRPDGRVTIKDLHSAEGFIRLQPEENELGFDEPASFNKNECLPLLTIGEMMEIMDRRNFSGFHFYLLAGTGITGCEVGNFRSELKEKILSSGYQEEELCDVLWSMIVSQL